MAPKKKKTAGEFILNSDTVQKIWTALTIDTWVDLLQKGKPDGAWKTKGKNDIWGRCPHKDHGEDSTPSFHVLPEKGYAKCFGCNWFEADPVRLTATVMAPKSYGDAFSYLVTTYGIPGLSSSLVKEAQDYSRKIEIKNYILSMLNAELVEAASTGRTDPKFAYAQPLVTWLESRKIDLGGLHMLPIGVVPPLARLWARLDDLTIILKGLKHHEVIQQYLKEIVPVSATGKGAYDGWILFANHVAPGQIGLFRIRNPATKDIVAVRESGNESPQMGFFGLGAPAYATVIGNQDVAASKVVAVCEGEFDALAVMQEQLQRGDTRIVVVATSGNNNHKLDVLAGCGFEEVLIIGDRDGGGDTFVRTRLRNTKMKSKVFAWPATIHPSKDLHDVWMVFGGDKLLSEVLNPDNYLFPHKWAEQTLTSEIASLDIDDVSARNRVAMQIGGLLNSRVEQDEFIKAAAKILGCPESELRKHMASVESDEGFITLLEERLKKEYLFLYKESTRGGVTVKAWQRAKNRTVEFDLAKKGTITAAINADSGSLVQWVESNLGILGRLKPQLDEETGRLGEGSGLDHRYEEYEKLLTKHAIPNAIRAAPRRTDLTVIGQGIHYKEATEYSGSKEFYVVNGPCFLKGSVRDDGGMFWTQVEGPIEGNLFVERAEKRWAWSRYFNNADDVNGATPVDLPAVFTKVKQFFSTGWQFKQHDEETTYLAGLVFSVALSDAFDALPWIFLNAPYQTGKSNLMLNTLSNTNHTSSIHLLESSFGTDVFSEAGVRQRMAGSTLMLILDEFEIGAPDAGNRRDKKGQAARDILNAMKGAQQGQGATVTIGTANGQPIEYHLRFAFAAAGINHLEARTDISRFNFVHLDATVDKTSAVPPAVRIAKMFTPAEIDEMRKSITMFALQNAARVKQAYAEVREEFSASQNFHPRTESRLKEGLLPVITILKMAGVDYHKFVTAYSTYKAEELERNYSTAPHDDVWEILLQSARVKVPGEEYRDRTFTISQLLTRPETRHLINETDTGLFYLEGLDLLVVNWATVGMSNLVRGTPLSGMKHGAAKAQLQNDKRIFKPAEIVSSGAASRIQQLIGLRRPENVCTVIPVRELISGAAAPTIELTDEDQINRGPASLLSEVGQDRVSGIKDSF